MAVKSSSQMGMEIQKNSSTAPQRRENWTTYLEIYIIKF